MKQDKKNLADSMNLATLNSRTSVISPQSEKGRGRSLHLVTSTAACHSHDPMVFHSKQIKETVCCDPTGISAREDPRRFALEEKDWWLKEDLREQAIALSDIEKEERSFQENVIEQGLTLSDLGMSTEELFPDIFAETIRSTPIDTNTEIQGDLPKACLKLVRWCIPMKYRNDTIGDIHEECNQLRSSGASRWQIFCHVSSEVTSTAISAIIGSIKNMLGDALQTLQGRIKKQN